MTRIRQLTLLLTLLFLLSTQRPIRLALAHADYDHSEPTADTVLATAPTQVRIWFTQELFRRQGLNSIEVYAADGARQDREDAAIDDDDRTLMTVSLNPALPAGIYTVRWHTVSAEDGHEGDGEFTFTVAAADGNAAMAAQAELTATPTDAPATATAPPPTATAPSPAVSPPCLGGAVPLVLAVGALGVGRRRQGGSVEP